VRKAAILFAFDTPEKLSTGAGTVGYVLGLHEILDAGPVKIVLVVP
jgi:hypothetical protein